MPSSDPAVLELHEGPASARVSSYAFAQLDRTAAGPVGGAADLLSAAWAEADAVREQARQEGFAAGHAEGVAAAQAEAAPVLAVLADAIRGTEALRDELVTTLESQAAELALRLSEQIVAAAIEVRPELVLEIARGALRRVAERHRVTLLVNPADLELMSESVTALRIELGGIDHLDVQADRRIDRGGSVVRTDAGEVDVTIAAQIQTARELVVAALDGGDADPAGADAA